jgi:hypothetical protein
VREKRNPDVSRNDRLALPESCFAKFFLFPPERTKSIIVAIPSLAGADRDCELMQVPSGPNPKIRVRIAFFCLFVFIIVLSIGAYFVADLGKLQETMAARESQAVLQAIADPGQVDEALRQHPSNKFLQMIAMATGAANETSAAAEKLANEVEPPAIAKAVNLSAASRNELEALRRDLKAAEANAAALLPRTTALFKTERDDVEKYALSLHLEKDAIGRVLANLDKRQAEMAAFTSRMSAARADYYRAYERYVAVLVAEFGAYKVVNGQFIFPFQLTVNRYNAAVEAMTAAARRVAELDEERKGLLKSQQTEWVEFIHGK